jgi:hypothetical protein
MKLGKQILKNTMVNLLAMYALEDLEKKSLCGSPLYLR